MKYNLENTMTYLLTFLEKKKTPKPQHKNQKKKENQKPKKQAEMSLALC